MECFSRTLFMYKSQSTSLKLEQYRIHEPQNIINLIFFFQEKVTSRKRSIGLGSGGAGEISEYQVNIMNMAKYVQSFQDRDDVSDKLKTGLKVDALLITGSKSSSLKACDAMFQNCNKVCFAFYRSSKIILS